MHEIKYEQNTNFCSKENMMLKLSSTRAEYIKSASKVQRYKVWMRHSYWGPVYMSLLRRDDMRGGIILMYWNMSRLIIQQNIIFFLGVDYTILGNVKHVEWIVLIHQNHPTLYPVSAKWDHINIISASFLIVGETLIDHQYLRSQDLLLKCFLEDNLQARSGSF